MLTYSGTHGPAHIAAGVSYHSSFNDLWVPRTSDGFQSVELAVNLGHLMSIEFVSRSTSIAWLCGHQDTSPSNDFTYFGLKPEPVSLGQKQYDLANKLRLVGHLLTDWDFREQAPDVSEHSVTHTNVIGALMGGSTGIPERHGVPYEDPDPVAHRIVVSDSAGWPSIQLDHTNSPVWGDVVPVRSCMDLRTLSQAYESGAYDHGVYYPVRYSALFIERDTFGIPFRVALNCTVQAGMYYCASHVGLEVIWSYSHDFREYSSVSLVNDLISAKINWRCDTYAYNSWLTPDTLLLTPLPDDFWSYDDDGIYRREHDAFRYSWIYSRAHSSTSSDPSGLVGWDGTKYVPSHGKSFYSFSTMAAGLRRDCYGLNVQSSNDAVSNLQQSLSSDHIEALSELGEVMEIVDVVALIGELRRPSTLARSFFRKKGVLSAAGKILDLLSSIKLSYSLAIAPTTDDAVEVASKARRVMRAMEEVCKPRTGHGKATAMVPPAHTSGFGTLKLTSHSKMRVRVPEDSFLLYILPIRNLGLLPGISAMWNLIPLSFVLDWVIPVGRTAKMIEDYSTFQAMELLVSVHSIKLEYQFDEETLISYGVTDSGPNVHSGYAYYERYACSAYPSPLPSRFLYRDSSGVPDWSLAASLMWKLK